MGMNLQTNKWILECASSASFLVLINGFPSSFLNPSWGLKQCCSLSPFLHLLVVDGLSKLIGKAKRVGAIRGIRVVGSVFLSHQLVVDDILLFSHGSLPAVKICKA